MAYKIKITYGLVSVDCKYESAVEADVSLSNMCVGQPGKGIHEALPVREPKTCTECGPIVAYDVLRKGVKAGQTYTVLTAEALEQITEAKEKYANAYTGELSVVPHPAGDFLNHTGQGDTLHYVTPADASAEGHYRLMVELIRRHPELAFAGLFTPRSATALFHLTVRDGVLVMAKRTREQKMKPLPSVGGDLNDKFLGLLEGSLDSFVTAYDPATYEDTYSAAQAELIASSETVTLDAKVAPLKLVSDDDIMAKLAALGGKAS